MTKEAPESLKAGRRELEGIKAFSIEKDLYWDARTRTWIIECQLTLLNLKNEHLRNTRWCLTICDEYPFGSVEFYPHRNSTLVQTYQHQDLNLLPEQGKIWRTGKPCLDLSNKALRKGGIFEDEPYTIQSRLYWRTLRLIAWLEAADENQLLKIGDPFELPPYPIYRSDWSLSFVEDAGSWATWAQIQAEFGFASCVEVGRNMLAVTTFYDRRNVRLIDAFFGRIISKSDPHSNAVLWLRAKSLPIVEPWQPPLDWGSLRSCLKDQGINIDNVLESQATHLVGRGKLLLIGAPIPRMVGDSPSQMHWLAVELPELPKSPKGFRDLRTSLWKYYRNFQLKDSAEVKWADTDNWARSEINKRGILSEALCSKMIAVIGGGTLGSIVSECLVRGGINKMIIIDKDQVEIGNLSRHSLDLSHIGKSKSLALAAKLNKAGPFNEIDGITNDIRRLTTEEMQKLSDADIIIDCTGNSDVLEFFERKPFSTEKLFISVSFGAHAQCLYYYSTKASNFPFSDFREKVTPALNEDRLKYPVEQFPRDGIGCWHNVFPARYDQIAAWGPVITQLLDMAVGAEGVQNDFKVIAASGL